ITVGNQPVQQLDILRIALREMIVRVTVVALGDRTVFAEIIDPDDHVAGREQLLDQIAADEPRRAGDQDLHGEPRSGSARQRSMTILPLSLSRSSERYCVCGVATITTSERARSSSSGVSPSCGR